MKIINSLLLLFLAFSVSAKDIKIASHNLVITSIVLNVSDDSVSIGTLLPGQGHTHHTSFVPSQIKNINDADIFIFNGLEIDGLDNLPISKDTALDISKVEGVKPLPSRSRKCCEDHAHSLDSHFWLDLDNIKRIAKAISDRLIQLNPERKDVYLKKYCDYVAQIDDLAQSLCGAFKNKTIYSAEHDITQYIDVKYGYKLTASVGLNVEAGLKPDTIKQVKKAIEVDKATHFVVERHPNTPNYEEMFGIKMLQVLIDPSTPEKSYLLAYFKAIIEAVADFQG